MTNVRIALARFTPHYFLDFSRALERVGFEVFWINALRSDTDYLRKNELTKDRILDTSDFDPHAYDIAECRYRLRNIETTDGPMINDIILMDRILRNKDHEFSIKYLGHLEKVVSAFLVQNQITIVNSGRDTALQLITMLICRRLGIPWIVPTRARIPQEMFGFCQRHDTEKLIQIHELTPEDRLWAENFLSDFEKKSLRPALKTSARSFADVIRLLPIHVKVFFQELSRATVDMGNDYARYTILTLIRKYIRRRINMFRYKLLPPYSQVGDQMFCFYAMHTQPESSIDVVGSYFSDQVGLINWIARSLPASHELYVKVHPTDMDGKGPDYYRRITQIPGVRLISHSIDARELLRRCSLVFTLSGTIGYEAGLMGKPVITFARNFFNTLPTVHFCDSPTTLKNLVLQLLDKPIASNWREGVLEFLAKLKASCFKGEVNRTYGAQITPLSAEDLAILQQVYPVIYKRLIIKNETL
jgi:hypothetical protein